MKIAKYIGDLIYDYECVVIPGLGGFISTEKSAGVDPLTNKFSPPSKEVHFNIHLKANDGLLINYVARNEEISFKNAKQRVDKFVLICHQALKDGKRINFSKIGYIYLDSQQNVVFKQDKTINYNANAFGLSSFVSPAIRRPSSEEKIKEVFTKKTTESQKPSIKSKTSKQKKDRRRPSEANLSTLMSSRRRPSKVKQQLIFVFIILFAFGSYYVINNRHAMIYYLDRYKVAIPFLYNNPSDYLAANAGMLSLEKINVSQAGWLSSILDFNKKTSEPMEEIKGSIIEATSELDDNVIDQPINDEQPAGELDIKVSEEIIADEPIEIQVEDDTYSINPSDSEPELKIDNNIAEQKVAVLKPLNQNKYFIIAGSFKNENNALNLVSSLRNQGYNALIADTNSYGMYRVALMGFSGIAEAENRIVAVKRDYNSQAWILKK